MLIWLISLLIIWTFGKQSLYTNKRLIWLFMQCLGSDKQVHSFSRKVALPIEAMFSLKQNERNRGPRIHHLNKQKSFGLEVSDKNCRPSLFRLSFYNYPFSMEICIFYLLYCHGEYKSLQLLNVLEQLLVLDWETAVSDW